MEPYQYVKFLAALIFVLSLMGGLSFILRRFSENGAIKLPPERRLKIVESLALDARRRAVILRRDNREHLVILGPTGETVIETGIELAQDSNKKE